MMPIAEPTGGAPLFQVFQTVSNRGETDKALIILWKMPSVSPFHRFGERLPRNFKWGRAAVQNSESLIPQNRETAKQIPFYEEISMTCLFQPV
jgi:hypothetical protein